MAKRQLITFQNFLLLLTALAWVSLAGLPKPYKMPFIILALGFTLINLLFLFFLISNGFRLTAVASFVGWMVIGFSVSNFIIKQHVWTIFEINELLGWQPQKNINSAQVKTGYGTTYTVSTDKYGLRNPLPYPGDKNLDFVIQGDSNVFGYGLNNTETLASVLTDLSGKNVYNFGVSGYDVNNFYFQYQLIRKKFSIDHRIIVFNLGNDFTASMFSTSYLLKRPYLSYENGHVVEITGNISRIKKQIYGYKFIEKFKSFDPLVEYCGVGRSWGDLAPDWISYFPIITFIIHNFSIRVVMPIKERMFSEDEIKTAEYLQPYYPDWLFLKKELWPQPYKDYSTDFEEIMRAVKNQNPELTIVYLPLIQQISDEKLEIIVQKLRDRGFKREDIDKLSMNKFLSQIGRNLNIRTIDCQSEFENHPDSKSLFQNDGQHLNAEGIKLLAHVLLNADLFRS